MSMLSILQLLKMILNYNYTHIDEIVKLFDISSQSGIISPTLQEVS